MATIAELIVALGVDSQGLDDGLDGINAKLDRVGSNLTTAGRDMTRNVTTPLLAAGAGMFALAGAQEDAEARMRSSFDSMGAAGWTTFNDLTEQAAAFQEVTTFGDEDIINFQSVLLTFGNVTGDVFTQATDLGLDMSAKLGTDLQSTAIQLGKALNDPVTGMTALSRTGVSFTEDQKEMVKAMVEAGDTAGAQALILSELELQFGGTAEAMALTGTGQAKQAMNALGDAGEMIGEIIVPYVKEFSEQLKRLSGWFQNLSPEAKEWVVRIGAIVAAIGPALWVGGKLINTFSNIGKAFKALSAIVSANPWVLLIAATVALVTLIVANWDEIKETVLRIWNGIKEKASEIWEGIKNIISGVGSFIADLFLNWTLPGRIIKHWDDIKAAATGVKDWVVDKFQAVLDFFKELPGKIGGFFEGLAEIITAPFRLAFNAIADLWNNTVGKLSFRAPDWIPLVGGKGWDVPDIPTFHNGGVYKAPTPGGEGLAWLADGETVTAAGATTAPLIGVVNVDARGNRRGQEVADEFLREVDRRLRLRRSETQRAVGI